MKKIGEIKDGYVLRFSVHMRIQHIILFVSLIMLALTGFALKYSHTFIGAFLIKIEGGITTRGYIHRFFSILLLLDVIYHMWYVVFTEEGHKELMLLIPRQKDIIDFFKTLRATIQGKESGVLMDKYGYREKFQYWGVVFGVVVMGITGFMMWFETQTMSILPKWLFDMCVALHAYGALLLFIILFIWHIYNVHFSPEYFPFNWEWWHGKRKLEVLKSTRSLEYERYEEADS